MAPCSLIERLPEDLLTAIISLNSPRDACSTAAVSRTFRAVADSDDVWSRFLTRDLPRFAPGELSYRQPSKKKQFMCLCDQPAILPGGLMSMWLDRATGAKCYTLSARTLNISWQDTPHHWRWILLPSDDIITSKRFIEAAQLLYVSWLEIRGKIHSKMLSQDSNYAAYLVFKLSTDGFWGLDFPFQEVTTNVGGSILARRVCIQGYIEDVAGASDRMPRRYVLKPTMSGLFPHPRLFVVPLEDDVVLPRKRMDGWMELELSEFYNDGDYDDEISLRLFESNAERGGLIVWGIEIRPKQQCC